MSQVSRPILPGGGAANPHRGDRLSESEPLEEVSLLGALNTILKHRDAVIGFALLLASILVIYALVKPRTYSSSSSFMPESRSTSNGLSGIAAQFGVSIPSQEGTESSQFYVDLLHTRGVLGAAVATKYVANSSKGPVSGTLTAIYQAKGENEALRRNAAMARLDRELRTSISAKTNVVTLAVTATDPVLARDINKRLIDLLSAFNLNQRQSRAHMEREFTEQRLADVKAQLRAVEDRLQAFLESNHVYNTAPALQFQRDRLQADVDVRRQLVTVLEQAVEQARIEEVRDTPVITVIEAPNVAVRPDGRGVVKLTFLGLFLGAAFGIALAFFREVGARPKLRESPEFTEFVALRHQAISDLTHPWRPIIRHLSRRQ